MSTLHCCDVPAAPMGTKASGGRAEDLKVLDTLLAPSEASLGRKTCCASFGDRVLLSDSFELVGRSLSCTIRDCCDLELPG